MQSTRTRINYRVADRDLKYYVFDWDDNILHMPTHIYLERRTDAGRWLPHTVSTAVFSMIRSDAERYRPVQGDWEYACRDFRDIEIENENIFLRDTRRAIDEIVSGSAKAAPSFLRFKTTLIEGRLFAIVTARGHEPGVIRAGVEYFIEQVLSPDDKALMLSNLRGYLECFFPGHDCETDEQVIAYYLDHNKYHAVRSMHFKAYLKRHGLDPRATEEGKQFAIQDFVRHVIRIARERGLTKPVSVGFSDDDPLNARAVEDFIRDTLSKEFPAVKFVVYYTPNPGSLVTRKVVVHGQLNLPLSGSGRGHTTPDEKESIT